MTFQEIPKTLRNQKTIDSLSHEWHSSMIIKEIKIFSQNIHKNNQLTDTILKV